MKNYFILILVVFLGSSLKLSAQEEVVIKNPVDSLYREDQIYINLSYSMLQNSPSGYKSKGYFSNLGFGVLRDFPLNKRRNIAVAPGIGYTFGKLNSNLLFVDEAIIQSNNLPDQNVLVINRGSYDKNKLTYHSIDVPLELRWRTSVPETHKFFRVYAGVKFSYIFYNKVNFKGDDFSYKLSNAEAINNFQTSVYLSVGYNTWNIYSSYGITPLIESKDASNIKMNAFNLGLVFYIL